MFCICSADYYRSSDRRFDYNVYQVNETDKLFKINETAKDSMTFSMWKIRWNDYNKGEFCDKNSQNIKDISYEFDDSTLKLKLNLPTAFFQVKMLAYEAVNADYQNTKISAENALPGSLQNLKTGLNELKLWSGLKPLKSTELPNK